MTKKYRTEIDTEHFIVNTDGEIESMVVKKICETQDEFMMTYLNSIDELIGLEKSLFQILICCWKLSSFSSITEEGNIINNTPIFRQRCRELGVEMNDNAINIAISKLKAKNILIMMCKGTYLLNPKYFLKGTMSKKSRMQLITEYTPK